MVFVGLIMYSEVASHMEQWNGLSKIQCDTFSETIACNNKVIEPNNPREIGLWLLGTGRNMSKTCALFILGCLLHFHIDRDHRGLRDLKKEALDHPK